MSECIPAQGATILQFPVRRRPQGAAPRAARELQGALQEQVERMQALRHELAGLHGSLEALRSAFATH